MAGRLRVGLLSTTIAAVGPMVEEFKRTMPEVDLLHFLDEGLVVEFIRAGGLSKAALVRTLELVRAAEAAGVKAILCSCSTLSPAFDHIRPFVATPVVEIDSAMAEDVSRTAHSVAIVATADSVLKSVMLTFKKAAARVGREPELKPVVLKDVYKHPRSSPEFFAAIARGLDTVAEQADAICVAQVSMIGCMSYVRENIKDRVHTGPPYAVREMKALLENMGN